MTSSRRSFFSLLAGLFGSGAVAAKAKSEPLRIEALVAGMRESGVAIMARQRQALCATTVFEVIEDAMADLGVLAPGESASVVELKFGLRRLRQILRGEQVALTDCVANPRLMRRELALDLAPAYGVTPVARSLNRMDVGTVITLPNRTIRVEAREDA